jgi:hypothetical protein
VAIVLPVLLLTASDYPFGIFWPLCCLSFDLRLQITPLVSVCLCIACPSTYCFLLPLWYLLAIVLFVLRVTASDYPLVSFGHCFVCPSSYGFWLPLWYLLAIVLSVLPVTASDYPLVSFGHCFVCPSSYGFWLPFGIFWPLFCLSFELRVLITLWYLLVIVLSVLPVTASDYPLVSFGHCFVCPSSYGFWLPFGIFWPLFCLSTKGVIRSRNWKDRQNNGQKIPKGNQKP